MSAGLTSFRACAFFAVFLFHTNVFSAGYLGVQAFFVLSGFLLTPILLNMRANLVTRDYFIRFYGRRALRIFPLYYAYLALAVILLLVWSGFAGPEAGVLSERFFRQLPWAATYAYNFFHASTAFEQSYFVTHFWSLAVEEQFYAFWPLVLFLVPVAGLRRFLLLVMLAGPVLRYLTGAVAASGVLPILSIKADLVVYVLPFSHLDAFAIGGYFALYRRRISASTIWFLLVSVILVGYGSQYYTEGLVIPRSFGYSPFMKGCYIWGYTLLNLLFAALLVQIRERAFLVPLFENRILYYMGTISYGMYVFHFAAIWGINTAFPGLHSSIRILCSLAVTIVASTASHELFEKRFIGLKDRLFPKDA